MVKFEMLINVLCNELFETLSLSFLKEHQFSMSVADKFNHYPLASVG